MAVTVSMAVNGKTTTADVEPRTTVETVEILSLEGHRQFHGTVAAKIEEDDRRAVANFSIGLATFIRDDEGR